MGHVDHSAGATVAEVFVPCVDVWGLGSIMSMRGKGCGRRKEYGEVGKNKKFAICEGSAFGNDIVIGVRNETVALVRVEVGIVVGISKEKDGDKLNGRIGNVEGIIEGQAAGGCFKYDGSHTKRINRHSPKALDWMQSDGADGFKV